MSASLPRRWLEQAREDLVVARLLLHEGHFSHACFTSAFADTSVLVRYLTGDPRAAAPRVFVLLYALAH